MRAIQVKEYLSGPQDMIITTVPDPVPKPDQYLIQIHATATNFFDLLQIRGKYQHVSPITKQSLRISCAKLTRSPCSNRRCPGSQVQNSAV